jgi:alkanesulfonate monooxygenase SsuD/methylene tetrahydromethanopterin reductase-like flavin-dependent oxidoreductase (luciferase family)
VDEVSGGRLTVAIGAGWNEAEFDAFGIPFGHRASRFEEAFEIVRRLLEGDRVTIEGRFHHAHDAVLLPRPTRRPPLMVGSTGPRVLAATLPHVDVWNTWYDWFGNTAAGFADKTREIDEACERAGRDPATLERSACVLVRLGDTRERADEPGVTPLQGSPDAIGADLREIAEAGADELILVLDPITEASVRSLGDVVPQLRREATG